jgi:hypothetical protein
MSVYEGVNKLTEHEVPQGCRTIIVYTIQQLRGPLLFRSGDQ